MDTIWQHGLDLLAESAKEHPRSDGLLNFLVVGELFDKLLTGTGKCQDPEDICDYLLTKHGWKRPMADQAAMLYSVVEAVRTSDLHADLHWSSDLIDQLRRE